MSDKPVKSGELLILLSKNKRITKVQDTEGNKWRKKGGVWTCKPKNSCAQSITKS